jgi:hypothetical protein
VIDLRDKMAGGEIEPLSPRSGEEAIKHLKQAIASGKHWYIALLEAIGLWTKAEEILDGRHYQYLIGGEAFDFLLLVERLLKEIDNPFPEGEKIALLFFGEHPIELPKEDFKALIGGPKYQAYLNYFYGVLVEQALLHAVEEEIYKERQAHPYPHAPEDAYQRIYGADESTLFRRFQEEKGCSESHEITLTELQEFTYWLFKYRLRNSDKARVASDTKKGLEYLKHRHQNLKLF